MDTTIILGIKWFHKVTNVEVLTRTISEAIHTHVSKRRLLWIGHIRRMNDDRLPQENTVRRNPKKEKESWETSSVILRFGEARYD